MFFTSDKCKVEENEEKRKSTTASSPATAENQ